MPNDKNSKFSITIDKIVAGGLGLGRRSDGMVVMVPQVLPGEQVEVKVKRRKKSFLECSLVKIEKKSTDRVEPPCHLYGECGGCDFQHISYHAQVGIKQAILQEHLVRCRLAESLEKTGSFLQEPAVSPNPFGYRLRIRLHIDSSGAVGMYHHHSHKVVPVENCLIAGQEINEILAALADCNEINNLLRHTSELQIFSSPDDGECAILLDFGRKPRPTDLKLLGRAASRLPGVKDVYLRVKDQGLFGANGRVGQVRNQSLIRLTLPMADGLQPVVLTVEPGGFYQINKEQNEKLAAFLLEFAELSGDEDVLDLFCGMGNFSLPLARLAGQVIGMDLQGSAVRRAKINAELSGIKNVKFLKSAAVTGAKKLVKAGKKFDLILLDPPRSGCREVLPFVLALGPDKIIYISCDPATLTRDLGQLVLGGNYRIITMRVVDMFPQTSHMETITLLQRK